MSIRFLLPVGRLIASSSVQICYIHFICSQWMLKFKVCSVRYVKVKLNSLYLNVLARKLKLDLHIILLVIFWLVS